MKKINRSKLGLNKDALKTITADQLQQINGGWVPSTSATCGDTTSTCTPHTITKTGTGTCV